MDEDDFEGLDDYQDDDNLEICTDGVTISGEFDEYDELMIRIGGQCTFLSRDGCDEVIEYIQKVMDKPKVGYTLH